MNPYDHRFDIQEVGTGGRDLVSFPDLPGIVALGDDVAETVERAHDLARVWLKEAFRYGCVSLPSTCDH